MPEISRFLGISITMYFKDHAPPHFHAEYNGFEAIFDINTLSKINGDLPSRVLGFVIEWASLHQQELLNNWESLNNVDTYTKIAPLV